jgi:hypothetical protein
VISLYWYRMLFDFKAGMYPIEPARRKMLPKYARMKCERMEIVMLRKTHNALLLCRDDKAAACRRHGR